VVERLYHDPWPGRVVLLDGNTGSGKTELLARAAARGCQVLDLEALAGHRGSLFGQVGRQASQKRFESVLAVDSLALDPSRPLLVEAESSRIGACFVPPALWKAMLAAPRIAVSATLAARVDYTLGHYANLAENREELDAVIAMLKPLAGGDAVARWQGLAAEGDLWTLVAELMEHHYDPRYAKSRRKADVTVQAERLDDAGLDALGAGIAREVERLA
jgi:tRNA 2-selenouridine synthase